MVATRVNATSNAMNNAMATSRVNTRVNTAVTAMVDVLVRTASCPADPEKEGVSDSGVCEKNDAC